MPVDAKLLELLACPLCKTPVTEEGDELVCGQCSRRYPVRDNIPIMLIDEAILPPGVSTEAKNSGSAK